MFRCAQGLHRHVWLLTLHFLLHTRARHSQLGCRGILVFRSLTCNSGTRLSLGNSATTGVAQLALCSKLAAAIACWAGHPVLPGHWPVLPAFLLASAGHTLNHFRRYPQASGAHGSRARRRAQDDVGEAHVLRNGNGMELHVLRTGAAVQRLLVPDAAGSLADVVLGFDNETAYEARSQRKCSPSGGLKVTGALRRSCEPAGSSIGGAGIIRAPAQSQQLCLSFQETRRCSRTVQLPTLLQLYGRERTARGWGRACGGG